MKIEVCRGSVGLALYVDDERVAGPRDNGLMETVLSANLDTARAPSAPEAAHPGAAVATHRHKKRGTEYALLGIGKMQAGTWTEGVLVANETGQHISHIPVDMNKVAIYRSVDDGSLWVRPKEEFEDGRFELIATPTPRPAAPTDGDIGALIYQLKDVADYWAGNPVADHINEAATALTAMSAKLAEAEQKAERQWEGWIKEEASRKTAEAANADLRRRVDAMWEALDDVTDDVAMLHNSVLSASIPASYKATLANRTKPIHDKLRALAARASGGSDA